MIPFDQTDVMRRMHSTGVAVAVFLHALRSEHCVHSFGREAFVVCSATSFFRCLLY